MNWIKNWELCFRGKYCIHLWTDVSEKLIFDAFFYIFRLCIFPEFGVLFSLLEEYSLILYHYQINNEKYSRKFQLVQLLIIIARYFGVIFFFNFRTILEGRKNNRSNSELQFTKTFTGKTDKFFTLCTSFFGIKNCSGRY